MKKDRILFLVIMILCIFLTSIGTAYAAILFDSANVSYNNTASGLTATKVQGAIDELYTKGTNYTTLKSRTTVLETGLNSIGAQVWTKSGSKSVPNSSWTSTATLTLSTAGTYLITGHFDTTNTSSSGRRGMTVGTVSDCSETAGGIISTKFVQALSANTFSPSFSIPIIRVEISSSTSYYACVYQNSGSAMSITGSLEAIRVK